MVGPLTGLRVVDVTWGMPGAVAGMVLADYGATVVRIERPGQLTEGPMLRAVFHRGKSSVQADLRTPHGRSRLHQLLCDADLFLESTRPGLAEALGFGYDELHRLHPQLVVCSISGYGQHGPLSQRPGYDSLVAARLGMMAEQAGHRTGPTFLGHPSLSYATGLLAVLGGLAALAARRRITTGQHVDTSLLDGAVALSCQNWWWSETGLSWRARAGDEPGFGRTRLIVDTFRCSDGEYLMISTGGEGGFKRTMDILGLGERVRSAQGIELAVQLDDDEIAARRDVRRAFQSRPREEWIRLLHAADIAALPVQRPGEALLDEQTQHSKVLVDVVDPCVGELRQAGPTIRFGATPAKAPQPAPRLGEITSSSAVEWLTAPSKRRHRGIHQPSKKPSSALEGIRVLDFSSWFAGAFAARLLADLGADVIKIEALEGDQMRGAPEPFEGVQRGKRAIAIDLRRSQSTDVVTRLIASADVLIHNLRPRKAERLGIGYDQARAINSQLVYCYLPGFGSTGPKADLKCFAPLLSGFVGLLHIGAGRGQPPVRRLVGNEDYYNGLLSATACLMALEHRAGSGAGQFIESPLFHAAMFAASEQCIDPSGSLISPFELDGDQTGWGPCYRLFETADGWVCIAAVGRRAQAALRNLVAVPAAGSTDNDEALAQAVSAHLRPLPTHEAVAVLESAGIACEPALDHPYMPDFLWEEWALESGRVFEQHHRDWGYIRELGLSVHLSDTPGCNQGPSPLLGEHTEELLVELGFETPQVQELFRLGCVAADAQRPCDLTETVEPEGSGTCSA